MSSHKLHESAVAHDWRTLTRRSVHIPELLAGKLMRANWPLIPFSDGANGTYGPVATRLRSRYSATPFDRVARATFTYRIAGGEPMSGPRPPRLENASSEWEKSNERD